MRTVRASDDPSIELAGERRQVTALFYDIVGSTELLVERGPEEYARIVTDFHKKASRIVREHGGFVYQELGDGGCGFFGYPRQLENRRNGQSARPWRWWSGAAGRAEGGSPS